MYEHSREYLLNYGKDKELWLKYLINKVIISNGQFQNDTEYLKNCYDILVNGKNCELEELPQKEKISKKNSPLYIKELNHISGVNVLKDNQKILFNDDITILFGQNGSGKSGYFRILNEICGGNEKKEIINNIYSSSPTPIEVLIKNSESEETLKWTNTCRGIEPYNKTSVYDTSYMSGLIEQRNTQNALIEPFGLHLFSSLIKNIEQLKNKIDEEINTITFSLPNIDTTDFSEKIKNTFANNILSSEIKNYIIANTSFKDNKKIEELENKINALKSINVQTEVTIRKEKIEKANNILSRINDISESINKNIVILNNLIEKYKDSITKVNEYKNKIEVLKQIPSIDTNEWEEFIKSADKYNKTLKQSNDVCIYCRNPLNSQSLEIINAYSEYLNNDVIQRNNNIEKNFVELENELKWDNIIIDSILKDDFEKLQIKELLNQFNSYIETCVLEFQNSIRSKRIVNIKSFEIDSLNEKLNSYIKLNKIEKEKLEGDDEKKKEEISKLETEFSMYKEKQSITNQKVIIESWINKIEKIYKLKKIKDGINTTQISTLSKKAHSELLTENLKSNFELELQKLGFNNLKVDLVEASAVKGIASTKLVVSKDFKITKILSEGEQKAVSLAMFLSEIDIRNDLNPIILDDPVNSLDHKVMKNFVERLLELDNQIIIFTHNVLFLSFFEKSNKCHICKNITNGCNTNKGKHIYLYDIKEESQTSKGIILNRCKDNYETHLGLAKKCLDRKEFDYERSAAAEIRYAIECLIDEKILLGIEPQKYSGKSSRINWDGLEKLGQNKTLLQCLKQNYDRLSGRKVHRGFEEIENSLQEIELREIIDDIESNCT